MKNTDKAYLPDGSPADAPHSVLVADDDLHILEVLDARLSSAGFEVLKAAGAGQAMEILRQRPVDLMISDMKMPDRSGLHLLSEARSLYPDLPVIFLTAYGTIPDAVSAVKAGAVEYLTKPFDGRELIRKVQEILRKPSAEKGESPGPPHSLYPGDSQGMKALYDMISRVAPSDVSVLILGESGVGKERVAHHIHELSLRREHPFLVVDCGSTPTTLLESELFGHVKGSFTHAVKDKKGLIEAADKGTLFLDEIGNISPEMQVRLLRFLEERKIRRIGDIREIPVDCRVLAATNANLPEEIRAGRFREDLYYRLRVVSLKIPPLRERKEDIPALVIRFAENFCKENRMAKVTIPQETLKWLCAYPWPGNVRELKNAVEASAVMCKDGVLRPEDFHLSDADDLAMRDGRNTESLSLEESERSMIIRALQQTRGIRKDAADLLGISRRAIHYKIKKYEIADSEVLGRG